ncbi:unnamed protein product [Trichobilharzia regenti]|nr:unnamed protein product [Trichobilharzia regenti]
MFHFIFRSTKEIQSSHTSVEDIFSRKLTAEEKLQLLKVVNSTDTIFPASDVHNNLQKTVLTNNPNITTNSFFSRLPESKTDSVTLNAVLPRYVLLKKDRLRGAYAFLGSQSTYVNVSFYIHQDQIRRQAWWELREKISSPSSDPCFDVIRHPTLNSNAIDAQVLSLITFNERVSDSLFGKVFNNYG